MNIIRNVISTNLHRYASKIVFIVVNDDSLCSWILLGQQVQIRIVELQEVHEVWLTKNTNQWELEYLAIDYRHLFLLHLWLLILILNEVIGR